MEKQEVVFKDYLMRMFSAYDWSYPFQSNLGWTKMRLGKHVAYPDDMPFDRVVELAEFLQSNSDTTTSTKTLVNVLYVVYNCGKNQLKKRDYDEWIK